MMGLTELVVKGIAGRVDDQGGLLKKELHRSEGGAIWDAAREVD